MIQYIVRRIFFFIPVLFVVSVLNYALYSFAPGDPITVMFSHTIIEGGDMKMTETDLTAMRARLGLDKPWPVRYAKWLGRILSGDLGRSLVSQREVGEIILKALGPTLQLNAVALAVGILLGVGVGVLQALKQYGMFDYTMSLVSYFYISVPGFFLALLLVYIFALQLDWLPAAGYQTTGVPPTWQDRVLHLILPALTLVFASTPGLMRVTRSSVLETVNQPYVTTARAKGLHNRTVVWLHVLRNSLIPVLTQMGSILLGVVTGSVVIEQIFAWPGMGRLALRAAYERDYPVLMALILLFSVMLVFVLLLVDIAYAIVDPRVQYGEADQ
jgi:peptide/nickel transport system permease protein